MKEPPPSVDSPTATASDDHGSGIGTPKSEALSIHSRKDSGSEASQWLQTEPARADIPPPLLDVSGKPNHGSPPLPSATDDMKVSVAALSDDEKTATGKSPSTSGKARKRASGTKSTTETPQDNNTPLQGTVLAFGLNAVEVERRVTFPSKMSKSSLKPYDNWTFRKVLGDDDFIASGYVHIRPNSEKPLKNVKDNSYVFLVLEGTVEVKVYKSTYILAPGGACLVPRGNNYSIKNISLQEAKIFFCQARKMSMSEDEELTRGSLLPSHRFDRPTSKALMLGAWILQRLIARFFRLRYAAMAWYKMNLPKYERFASGRRLYFLCFLLGLALRRLPFIGSPPLINIQIVQVV